MACCHVFKAHPSGKICVFDDCKKVFFGPLTAIDAARFETFKRALLTPEKGLKGTRLEPLKEEM